MKSKLIRPRSALDASVTVPGSKSIANRALVLAALGDGVSTLTNVPDGDDTKAMLGALSALGVNIVRNGATVQIHGPVDLTASEPLTLDADLAGTTSRFLTALAALRRGPTTIDGLDPLRARPNADLRECLSEVGARVQSDTADGLPVTLSRGEQNTDHVRVRGNISSQFLTALLLIASSLPRGLRVEIVGDLVSRSYVEMTVAVMRSFGVEVEFDGLIASVSPGEPKACVYDIEPDASSASYPLAAAAIAGGSVSVRGLGGSSLQSDSVFADHLAAMGCTLDRNDSTRIKRDAGVVLHGIDIDMRDCSDLVPTMATVCCFADSESHLRGIGFIRNKESNRIEGLAAQLAGLGGNIEATDDGLIVRPSKMRGGSVDTLHDHRIAMALALVGLSVDGVEINDPDVVSKSWPGYWDMLDAL